MTRFKSQGTGKFKKSDFAKIGKNVVFESGVVVIHPENIEIGSNIYIGHNTILEGYHQNKLIIKDNVWIGPTCYIHAAGGLKIGPNVGIGPGTKILTSSHDLTKDNLGPIVDLPLGYAPIEIKEGTDVGMGAIILPGVTIASGTQVGAGAVVTKDTERYSIVAGVPARKIGLRESAFERVNRPKKSYFKQIMSSIVHLIRYIFDLIFFVLLPLVFCYVWLRFFIKKIFDLKPNIIFSPLGAPIPFFAVKAAKSAGFKADNISYDTPAYFRPISYGLILGDHWLLKTLIYLTDYTFLFIWVLIFYDIFEFAFSGGILTNSHLRKFELPLLKILAKKISVYGYGSDCKLLSDVRKEAATLGIKYNTAMDRDEETTETNTEKNILANVKRAQKYADVLIAGADLIHLGDKAVMLPLAVDLSLWKCSVPKNNKKVTIIHSTNHRTHKGTRFILEIVNRLAQKFPIDLMLIEKKTIAECQKLYPQGDIFIPDVITGWHGLVAIEAMATGRPVITYLRDDFMKYHSYYAKGNIPAISADPDHLAQAIIRLVKNLKLRRELGRKGRDYVEKFHSLEFGGNLREILYEYIWSGKKINQEKFEREVKKRGLIS